MSKWNFFNIVTVDGYGYPTQPQVSFGFNTQGFSFLNRGSDIIYYSFDGINNHGDLDPSDSSIGITFDERSECKVWFKASGGLTSTVRVEGWRSG